MNKRRPEFGIGLQKGASGLRNRHAETQKVHFKRRSAGGVRWSAESGGQLRDRQPVASAKGLPRSAYL